MCALFFSYRQFKGIDFGAKRGKVLLEYIMLNLLSSLQQDVIETCRVARLSKGPHNYVTLAPFETAT